uniref:Gem-associated protein 4 n=1 Tax=Neogobius melanostomus TaxID=47308 RepID=A0A8C6WLB7_9GOBI
MNKDFAVMQGAFLSANRVSPLCSLLKPDWDKVGCSILDALREISLQKDNRDDVKKTLLCAVWLKLLSAEAEEDIEVTWRESSVFALQNGLPDLNRVVFLELVRSTTSINHFTRLLLCLPPSLLCAELQKFVQHISSSPVREEDLHFFLGVWQELWRIEDVQSDSTEEMFAREVSRLSSNALQQPAKRIKLDTPDCPDILYILFHALRDLKDQITAAELGFRALSISLNALYTSFLIDAEAGISTKEKLEILTQMATIRERNNEKLSPKMVADSLKDLKATQVPSKFKPLQLNLGQVLAIIAEVTKGWFNNGLLKVEDRSNPSYSMFTLKLSLQNVFVALDETSETIDYTFLKNLFDSLDFSKVDASPDFAAKITMTVISHKMDDYLNFALLFAGEKSWAACDESYIDFLEKNQSAFRDHEAVVQLAQSIVGKFNSGSVDVGHYRKLMKVTADIFSALNVNDKNKALAAVMDISTRGFFGSNTPPTVTTSFEQELNMAFNCIIQGGGGTSVCSNLNTAASLVARVAFQNPEAAVKAMCNSAISNKGAFTIMAKILQLLLGLSGRLNESARDTGGKGLLCKCVKGIMKAKQMSQDEKEQLVKFLCLLMQPAEGAEGEGRGQSFILPQMVIYAFVLPNLALGCVDLEMSLQLLHRALCMPRQEGAPHWVMLCSPFPLLFVLAQLHNHTLSRRGGQTSDRTSILSMETRELLVTVLVALGQVVGAEVMADSDSWSRALFWLYNKTEELDWTVRFLLKPVWGEHFKNEVPASLLAVCDLPEQEWSGVDLPQYGPGTGLVAWIECCCISDTLQSTMLSCLSLDQRKPDHVNMFSKGLLVALTQALPCCSLSQWSHLLRALRSLIDSGRLHVPFSLEYCDFLPLLDLRRFACELRLSVLLLRVFQLLCGSSCAHWLSRDGWGHVGTLYSHAVREMIGTLKAKLPLTLTTKDSLAEDSMINHSEAVEEKESVPSQRCCLYSARSTVMFNTSR